MARKTIVVGGLPILPKIITAGIVESNILTRPVAVPIQIFRNLSQY
jgi:hypothetical protein